MNGVNVQNLIYYIEELEMVLQVKSSIKNVMIKAQLFVYIKMNLEIFLEDMHLFLGKNLEILNLQKAVFPSNDTIVEVSFLPMGAMLFVIMLTARDAVMDKVSGLDAGADDYITTPFAIEELLARIRVNFKKRGGKNASSSATKKMEMHGVMLDEDRHEVSVNGELIELTNREFELLHTLMLNKNIVMSRDKLMNLVCGYDYVRETNIIDVYVRYLRTKIDDRFNIKLITTVRGVGYVIKE